MKISHSLVMRIYLAVFFVFWALVFLTFTARLATDHSFFVIVPTALLLLELSIGFKALRVGVFYDEDKDRLIIRNYFGNEYLPRRNIRMFDRAPDAETGWLTGTPVRAITHDRAAHPMDVFTRPLITSGSKSRHQNKLEELQEWLKTRR